MRGKIVGAAVVTLAFLALAPAALANFITNASLTCTALTFNYSEFNGDHVQIAWFAGSQPLETQTLTLTGAGTQTITPPVLNGMLSARLTWPFPQPADHTLTVSAPGTCNTAPPPTPPSPPSPPPPSPPTTPPTPPPTPAPPTPSGPGTPPGSIKSKHTHRPTCVRLRIGQVHVTMGPQRLITGNVTYIARAPAIVKSITVAIYGVANQGVKWSHTYRGHGVILHIDVTKEAFWGDNPRVHSTFGVHLVKTTFHTNCGQRSVSLAYDNQDPPRR